MWLKSKAGTYLFYLLANLCSWVHDACLNIKCLRGQMKCIPALDPEGQTFNKTGPSMKEWEQFLT